MLVMGGKTAAVVAAEARRQDSAIAEASMAVAVDGEVTVVDRGALGSAAAAPWEVAVVTGLAVAVSLEAVAGFVALSALVIVGASPVAASAGLVGLSPHVVSTASVGLYFQSACNQICVHGVF